jgi:hypothetical protein
MRFISGAPAGEKTGAYGKSGKIHIYFPVLEGSDEKSL